MGDDGTMTKGTRYTPEFKASAPNRLHVADITYVRMADGRFGYTAFVTDAFARCIVGWACATSMDTEELLAGVGAGDRPGRGARRNRRARAPFRPWRAVHRHRLHHQGDGIRHASLDRHAQRLADLLLGDAVTYAPFAQSGAAFDQRCTSR